MKLLALETSTEACSCALLCDTVCHQKYALAPRQHADLILEMVSELLAAGGYRVADLDGLAFGRGPGSFTGVRIATAVTQGLGFAGDLPVAGVSSLQALAQGAHRELRKSQVIAALDARMGEIYWGAYSADDGELLVPVVGDQVGSPRDVGEVPETDSWYGVGSGWAAYGEEMTTLLGPRLAGHDAARFPQAQDVALLGVDAHRRGEAGPAETALPVYLRDKVAVKPTAATKRTR
ncbi:MAG: tRNA (adenosine(37)-N6)-threonylcarbamoyltransferase complex dimerization subunit type 1 TsaB [Gammaproteobacteria bacterium]|nr:MAG: tRNA (adenosine(37)-N6)-threonylcarbamoyltransferase complex dimerization subunit type 1 TsaB [Gammaproteobacteria bacterium]